MDDIEREQLTDILCNSIQLYLKQPKLLSHQRKKIVDLFNKIDPKVFINQKASDIIQPLTKILGDRIAKENTLINMKFDTHEYIADSIGTPDETNITAYRRNSAGVSSANNVSIDTFLGINDLNTLKMLLNPESLYVKYYVVLDSNNRNTSAEGTTISKFTWDYAETQNLQTGVAVSVGNVRDVICMRLYQPRMPFVSAMDGSAGRVSVLIEEFKAQSFICNNGWRFHFLYVPDFYNMDLSANTLELAIQDYNDGLFYFRKPITTFNTLTLLFGDPTELITFTPGFTNFIIPIEFVCYKTDK